MQACDQCPQGKAKENDRDDEKKIYELSLHKNIECALVDHGFEVAFQKFAIEGCLPGKKRDRKFGFSVTGFKQGVGCAHQAE